MNWRQAKNESDTDPEIVPHFARCLGFVGHNRIEGDILEFGVYQGRSLIILDMLAKQALRKRHQRDYRIVAFDSFQGLPAPGEIDRMDQPYFEEGMYSCTAEEVRGWLRQADADLSRIQLIEGWYDEKLTEELRAKLRLERACLINIDCDFYESTKLVLHWCEPLLQQGTIISFDDWFCYQGDPRRGVQLAFHEFLEENRHFRGAEFSAYSFHGRAFVISDSRPAANPF